MLESLNKKDKIPIPVVAKTQKDNANSNQLEKERARQRLKSKVKRQNDKNPTTEDDENPSTEDDQVQFYSESSDSQKAEYDENIFPEMVDMKRNCDLLARYFSKLTNEKFQMKEVCYCCS